MPDITHLQATRYLEAVALSLFIWEYLITFDKELKYFWRVNWSWQKFLFFANRYFTLVSLVIMTADMSSAITNKFCTIFIRYLITYFGLMNVHLVQGILSNRVYVIYRRPQVLKYCLIVLFGCCSITTIALIAFAMHDIPVTAHPFNELTTCAMLADPSYLWAIWVPPLVYEGVIFFLASRRAIKHLLESPFNQSCSQSIMNIILRDSLIYFFFVFVTYASCAILWRYGSSDLFSTIFNPAKVVLSILATRMMFNLKDQGVTEDIRRDVTTLSNVSMHAEGPFRRVR